MGSHYRHLTVEDRITLFELLFTGTPIIEIAQHLGFHKATIYRELERNSSRYGYRPDWASQQYRLRQQTKLSFKLDKNIALKTFVIAKLQAGWSPQQIDGRLRLQAGRCVVSHETIYAYIYSPGAKDDKLYKLLQKQRRYRYPRNKRRRHKPAKEADKIGIAARSEIINHRETYGHWEGDLMVFSRQRENLITLRERKSRYLLAIKNQTRQAQTTTQTLIHYMQKKLMSEAISSLTLDNDTSFVEHKQMAKSLEATVYFCGPYKSYQKGAIENGNRLLRAYFPRQTLLAELEQAQIDEKTQMINNKPMKCLGYQTPNEVFFSAFSDSAY